MSKCPKCKYIVNFINTITLTRYSNRVICQNCDTVLEADKTSLNSFGVIGVILFLIVAKNANSWLGIENQLIGYGIGFIFLIVLTILFYFRVKLRVSKNQDKKELVLKEVQEIPDLPENYTRVEYLKIKFYYKSNDELEFIVTDKNRIPEAKRAAKELLNERKNVT